MTRWKRGQREFDIKLANDYSGNVICRVPQPIIEMLGNPDSIKFEIHGKKTTVVVGEKQ